MMANARQRAWPEPRPDDVLSIDGERWWITGGQFQNEGPELPLPDEYGGGQRD